MVIWFTHQDRAEGNSMQDEILIEKYTLLNAVKYNGKADLKSTMGAIIQTNPKEFKTRIPEIKK